MNRYLKPILLIVVFTLAADLSLRFLKLNLPFLQGSLIEPQVFASNLGPKSIFDTGDYQPSTKLENAIRARLQAEPGDFAVVAFDLTKSPKTEVSLNADQPFPAGSLYKLFVLAAVLKAEESGQLQDDQQLTATVGHLNEVLGGVEYGYEDYDDNESIAFSVNTALDRVSRFSDNYSAILLAEAVGWDQVQAMANQLGATSTSIKDPITTTAQDIGLYFRKLYAGEVVSRAASDRIIDLLDSASSTDRIPDQLPKELQIAHKTGELSLVRNDAGIVFLDGRPYVIVMLSKDLTYEDAGSQALSDVSKLVYDYFSTTH